MAIRPRRYLLLLFFFAFATILTLFELSERINHLWFVWTEPVIPVYDPERHRTVMETKPREAHNNMTVFLNWNPAYKKLRVQDVEGRKKRVTLLLIVSTAPRRFDRRKAIRDTFWEDCKKKNMVTPECLFFTDKISPDSEHYQQLQNESQTYKDVKFQNLQGGVEFGSRLMYHMLFAVKHYDFDYFLRMDDDYFLCLDNLMTELPLPVVLRFHWGWVHTSEPTVRPEESMIMLSFDLIIHFLTQQADVMKCHPLADQMIAHWVHELGINNVWRHDERLLHHAMKNKAPGLLDETNICSRYMGIHGAYPKYMRTFWSHRGSDVTLAHSAENTLLTNSKLVESEPFDWRYMSFKWRHKPKFCLDNPTWEMPEILRNTNKGSYGGRQEALD